MRPEALVVGAGPAGLMAASQIQAAGHHLAVLEQNDKPGKKLYITGKGRCNVSNLCELDEFLSNVPRNPRFLYSALKELSPKGLRDWLHQHGCPTVVERGQRVFPKSQKASDVTRSLLAALGNAPLHLNTKVKSLVIDHGAISGLLLDEGTFRPAKAVVLCTGGLSYPLTGSTGDGHLMAQEAGHQVEALSPSLTGLNTRDEWPKSLQGLSLRNVVLQAEYGKKGRFSQLGELLFTHYGVSGPLVLSLSAYLAGLDVSTAKVSIDMKPALDPATLQARLQQDISQQGRKSLAALLPAYLPASLATIFPVILGLQGDKALNQLTSGERQELILGLKALPIKLLGHRSFKEAVVTRGGVNVRQVNPSTMESKLIRGLFFAGELLDVDALTGGFNLQIAFSTGALAGKSCARYLSNNK